MLKQKPKISIRSLILPLLAVFVLAGMSFYYVGVVKADQFDAQIRALQQKNSKNQAAADVLGETASNYQQTIDKLQAKIDSLQNAITQNQKKSDQLETRINAAEKELEKQKGILGEDIKQMYLEGQISTLEILASSSSLSDFIDKEQYRSTVQDKLKTTVDQINALKAELESKQQELKALIVDQKNHESDLAQDQARQNHLLSFTQAQKAAYDRKIRSNNEEIASLRAQQLAQNESLGGQVVAGDPGHGGYPAYLDNAAQDSLIDPWGMYNRECVSYTAWKVQQYYHNMPYWGGSGNANQWVGDAQRYGVPTGSVPKVHSVAIYSGGAFGHAMWVEAVSGNMIYVSQYNFDLAGHYSEMWVNGSGFTYLYFGQWH